MAGGRAILEILGTVAMMLEEEVVEEGYTVEERVQSMTGRSMELGRLETQTVLRTLGRRRTAKGRSKLVHGQSQRQR